MSRYDKCSRIFIKSREDNDNKDFNELFEKDKMTFRECNCCYDSLCNMKHEAQKQISEISEAKFYCLIKLSADLKSVFSMFFSYFHSEKF